MRKHIARLTPLIPLSAQLQPAATYLVNQYGQGKSFDALNIFVAETNDSAVLGGYGIDGGYIDRSSDTKDVLLIGGDKADVFHGGTGNDVLQGGDGLDILYGEGGDDTLVGGKGIDILKGGDGNDTYIFKTGDGSDTIEDSDGKGSVNYDNTNLGGGSRKKGESLYKSSDQKYFYSWAGDGADLTINGSITVKNFHNGDLGISLKEDPDKIPPKIKIDPAQHIPTLYDPLTLDLNGNGIETVPTGTPPLLFDISATGIKTSTGWIAPSDGLLVLDRNGNGMIDSGAELFGNATPLNNGTGTSEFGTLQSRAAVNDTDYVMQSEWRIAA